MSRPPARADAATVARPRESLLSPVHDLVIVGAGPVGATLALALRDSDLDIVALDARPAGSIARSDRSLALSHGARLIFERLGVWGEVAAATGAVTPITSIDISQRAGFGRARLHARDQGVDALGYVVSYRALQHALDAALTRAGVSVEHDVKVTRVDTRTGGAHAQILGQRDGATVEWSARLAAIADGGGDVVGYIARRKHDYEQVALVAKVWSARAAWRPRVRTLHRRRPDGASAGAGSLRTGVDNNRRKGGRARRAPGIVFPDRACAAIRPLCRAVDTRCGPAHLCAVAGICETRTRRANGAPRQRGGRRCIRLRARASTSGFAMRLNWRRSCLAVADAPSPADLGATSFLAGYARRRSVDRWSGIAFTHGLLTIFGADVSLLRWPRGLALTFLDAVPRSSECSRVQCSTDCVDGCSSRETVAIALRLNGPRGSRAMRVCNNRFDKKRSDERADQRAANSV